MKEINAKGLPCPKPLMATKKALGDISIGDTLCVIVNDTVPRDNIVKYIKTIGLDVSSSDNEGEYRIEILKNKEISQEKKQSNSQPVIIISSDSMGEGDKELGQLLMKGFLNTLPDVDILPARIIFYNSGVNLLSNGSGVLDSLKTLVSKGVIVSACGTCLDFYNLKDNLAVGSIIDMLSIIEIMSQNTNIVKP